MKGRAKVALIPGFLSSQRSRIPAQFTTLNSSWFADSAPVRRYRPRQRYRGYELSP